MNIVHNSKSCKSLKYSLIGEPIKNDILHNKILCQVEMNKLELCTSTWMTPRSNVECKITV